MDITQKTMDLGTYLKCNRPLSFKGHGLESELVISLTSQPKRYKLLHYTLKSLINQTVKPDRIVLYLCREEAEYVTQEMKLLCLSGVEIRVTRDNIRSYKKIIPTLIDFPEAFIVTADDDIIYKSTWLEELVEAYKVLGGVVAQRAHLIQYDNRGNIQPYNSWLKNTPSENRAVRTR